MKKPKPDTRSECPRCHERGLGRAVGFGMLRCKGCRFTAVRARFYPAQEPLLHWAEATDPGDGFNRRIGLQEELDLGE